MANQPTKYRKFLVGAASAALVASAVAPVASAATPELSDVQGNTHAEGINALIALGAISGYPDGTFKPNQVLTRSDVVKMMGKYLVALGQEIPGDYKTVQRFNDLPLTANEELLQYAALVKDAGVFNGTEAGNLDPTGKITRENMALVLVRAFDAILDRDLVAEVAATTFNKEVTDLASAKTEAHGAINVLDFLDITTVAQFNPKGSTTRGHFATFLNNTIKAEAEGKLPQQIVTEPKVESVSATNLKEVVVTFNTAVDKETGSDKANYSLKSGKAIDTVKLADDQKSVVLTVVGSLTNNKADHLNVSNVKAGDKEINVKDIEFKVVDNEIPVVKEVKSLGTKSLKITFSEPVEDVKQNNFTLDGKAYFGKVKVTGNEVILTPYDTAALAVGDHTVVVEKVKDFAGFMALRTSHDFTVVEDKVAPTIDKAEATLEKVTITFSEEIDDETVVASNVYWKSGNDKRKADTVKQLSSTEFEFTFLDADSLPTGSIDIYVEGVKDYSGNEIAKDTKVSVTPVVDQTRPEVKKVTVTSADTVKIQFSKNVLNSSTAAGSATNVSNYTLLDKDGKVISIKEAVVTEGNIVTLTTYSNLSTGKNKLTVKNVKDNTKLQNTMLDFSADVTKDDSTQPKIDSKTANADDLRVVIGFDEKMDVATLANYSNYLVKIDNTLQALNSNIADISVVQDGKVVVITFNEKIGSKDVSFTTQSATKTKVEEIQVLAVKDLEGNFLEGFTKNDGTNIVDVALAQNALSITETKLVNKDTVEFKFNAAIVSAPNSAFSATGNPVKSVEVNGTSTVKVKFEGKFDADAANLAGAITVDGTKLVTLAGTASTNAAITALGTIVDKVAPSLVTSTGVTGIVSSGDTLVLTFDEAINATALGLLASDLDIRIAGTVLKSTELQVSAGATGKVNIKVLKTGFAPTSDVNVTLTNNRFLLDGATPTANEAKLFTNVKATGTFSN
ncbi:S-layer homology domain-containing protein [Sporosarcina sp. FSL K6-2383]|uniref:S-layer homology domain-containing protein n=1 Tax=Sporosarcina sp. FSL K6-2383 TaxID=2921556 RepID=UPI00315B256B